MGDMLVAMTEAKAPKFFVPGRSGATRQIEPGPPAHVLDVFRLSGPHAYGGTWVVLVDANGWLSLAPASSTDSLPSKIQEGLSLHLQLGPIRHLDLASLHLLAIESIDAGRDLPGLNDPLLLRGTLFGPFPSAAPAVFSGSLTLTRADVLQGLLRGLSSPFHLQSSDSSTGAVRHLFIPGDEDAELRVGRGALLAFPLPSALVELGDPANEHLILGLFQELLAGLKQDPAAEGIPLATMEIPTANRASVAAQLEARGFTIEGHTARRDKLGLLGGFFPDRVPLPPQGTLAQFAQLAAQALHALPDCPSERSRTLSRHVRAPLVGWDRGVALGLTPVEEPRDGRFRLEGPELVSLAPGGTFALTEAARLKATRRVLWFVVDQSFALWNCGRMQLEVELFDSAPGDLQVKWEHGSQLHAIKQDVALIGGDTWRTLRIELENPLFEGAQHGGAGLQLQLRGPRELRIRRVTIRPEVSLAIIEPFRGARAAPTAEHGPADGVIDIANACHQVACGYVVSQNFGVVADCMEAPSQSPLSIYEDGVPLGPPHSPHVEIRSKGAGRYSFWISTLFFSASDNTDPTTNGRSYIFRRRPFEPPESLAAKLALQPGEVAFRTGEGGWLCATPGQNQLSVGSEASAPGVRFRWRWRDTSGCLFGLETNDGRFVRLDGALTAGAAPDVQAEYLTLVHAGPRNFAIRPFGPYWSAPMGGVVSAAKSVIGPSERVELFQHGDAAPARAVQVSFDALVNDALLFVRFSDDRVAKEQQGRFPVRTNSQVDGLVHDGRVVAGRKSQALDLNGVRGALELNLPELLSGDAVTFSFWLRYESYVRDTWRSFWMHQTEGERDALLLCTSWGRLRWGKQGLPALSRGELQLQTWYHVTMVADGERRRLYVDGVPQIDGAGRWVPSSDKRLWFGRASTERTDTACHGQLEDLLVFPRVMSNEEVAGLYRCQV